LLLFIVLLLSRAAYLVARWSNKLANPRAPEKRDQCNIIAGQFLVPFL